MVHFYRIVIYDQGKYDIEPGNIALNIIITIDFSIAFFIL